MKYKCTNNIQKQFSTLRRPLRHELLYKHVSFRTMRITLANVRLYRHTHTHTHTNMTQRCGYNIRVFMCGESIR